MAFDTFPCNPYPISKGMLEKGNNDELNTRVTALEGEVSDLNDTKANQITIAPFFSAEASYEVGDLVYYNGLSYRCTNDHEGEWDADDFAATTVSNELATLKSGLTNLFKTATETATADSNGYFPTSLNANNRAIVSVKNVVINDEDIKPYKYEVLLYGGSDAKILGLKLKSFNDSVIGANETWTVQYIYVEL